MNASILIVPMASKKLAGGEDASEVRREVVWLMPHVPFDTEATDANISEEASLAPAVLFDGLWPDPPKPPNPLKDSGGGM